MNRPPDRHSPLNRLGSRSLHLYLLATAAIVIGYLAISQLGAPASSARTETEIVPAAYGVVQTTATGSGSVEAGVDDEVNFATSGTLEDVYVHEGETVKKGQILARLDPSSAKLTLAEAELSLKEAKLALTDAEDGDTTTTSSDGASSSGTGTTTTTSDASEEQAPLERVEYASYRHGSDDASTSTSTTPTTTTTSANGTTTTTPAQTKTSATRTVTVTVPATTPAKTTSSGSSSTGADSEDTSSTSDTTTVSATTIDADELTVESDEETVASDEKAVDETTLRAPVSGTIASLEDISPGDSVSADSSSSDSSSTTSTTSTTSSSSSGTTAGGLGGSSDTGSSSSSDFAEIVNTKTLTMTVAFSEADIGEIKVGQPATVTLDALSGVELAGYVSAISSEATEDDDVVSYDVTLTIDQTDSKVRPGMSASATVIVKQADGVTVPNAAVSGTGSEGAVTLVENGKHVEQEVVVGLRGNSRTEVESGLKAGQDVLITETLPSLGESTTTTSTSSSGTLSGTSGFSGTGGLGERGTFGGGAAAGGGGPP